MANVETGGCETSQRHRATDDLASKQSSINRAICAVCAAIGSVCAAIPTAPRITGVADVTHVGAVCAVCAVHVAAVDAVSTSAAAIVYWGATLAGRSTKLILIPILIPFTPDTIPSLSCRLMFPSWT